MLHLYDGGFDGLLTALFTVYARRDADDEIQREAQFDGLSLFPVCRVQTDPAKAARVMTGMRKLSSALPPVAYRAFLSEQPGMETALLQTLRIGFAHNEDPLALRHEEPVGKLLRLNDRVSREVELFLGTIRFVCAGGDVYLSDIAPDYHILPLIGRHFHVRFGDQRLVIRDVRRRIALVSVPQAGWHLAVLPQGPLPPLPKDANEELWKAYFQAIANPARINPKLQQRFVPLKYRKYIAEFQ